MSPESSVSAQRQLERLGVEVITGSAVTAIDNRGVTHDGTLVETRTVIWAAGVAASALGRALNAKLDRAGRVLVDQNLAVEGLEGVFVVGDLASIQKSRGEPMVTFRYRDKGTLATIGKAAAVGDIGRLRVGGLIAWLIWLFVHIFFLIGFRNRFLVISEWAWMYLRNDRGARLITGDIEPLLKRGEKPGERERMLSR
jgi:NADH dehydrogenase